VSRERENLLPRSTLFIGMVKRTYGSTPMVKCTFIGRPITRRLDGKKHKRPSGLQTKKAQVASNSSPHQSEKAFMTARLLNPVPKHSKVRVTLFKVKDERQSAIKNKPLAVKRLKAGVTLLQALKTLKTFDHRSPLPQQRE
jgi:hypothetical protein